MPHTLDPTSSLFAVRVDGPATAWPEGGGRLFGSERGVLAVDLPTVRWAVPPGHAVWLPPHATARMTAHGTFAGWCVGVGAAACVDLPPAAWTGRPSTLLSEAARRATSWPSGPLDAPRWRIAGVLLDELRAMVPVATLGLPMPCDERLRAVAEALLADLAHDPGVDHWAEQAGVAARTLTRQFAAETGLGVADWRQRARLLRALEGLADGRDAGELAQSLGYDSLRTFAAMFRRETGLAPARYFAPSA